MSVNLISAQCRRLTPWVQTGRWVPCSSSREISGAPQNNPTNSGRKVERDGDQQTGLNSLLGCLSAVQPSLLAGTSSPPPRSECIRAIPGRRRSGASPGRSGSSARRVGEQVGGQQHRGAGLRDAADQGLQELPPGRGSRLATGLVEQQQPRAFGQREGDLGPRAPGFRSRRRNICWRRVLNSGAEWTNVGTPGGFAESAYHEMAPRNAACDV